ncbi:RIP metalloprotease RseP [Inediibacterium massiliense]|uniref:RIP metalloprotease RseP n=1 Tax=Inediibacterium massiliense TaxID=1658111 RepID=UPI0006B551C8|nr:RIP metalloprotease RseP [Inediibacterium massiliense]
METILSLITEKIFIGFVAIVVFGVLVVFHEFGHFSVAKLVGIKVHEFSIGMGPRIFKKKGQETEYSIRILPLGGYVKMEGEDEKSNDARSFNNKPLWARISVILAGPFMNFVLAILLFTTIFYMIGFPTTTIQNVMNNSPAQKSGIQAGDKILSINEEEMNNWQEIQKTIQNNKNPSIDMKILRQGNEKSISIIPRIDEKTKKGAIGIAPKAQKSFLLSIKAGWNTMFLVIDEMIGFFGNLFKGKVSSQDVVGPVGIIYLVGEAAKTNIYNVLRLAALISVNLGIVNLLPIPALDGGRIVFLLAEGIVGRPLDPEKEGFIHFTAFVLLMGLMVFMIYKDIMRFY